MSENETAADPGLRDKLIAAMAGLPVEEWDGDREVTRLRIVYGNKADRLLPVVAAVEQQARERAAVELEKLAEERSWTTEHDNEVVSTREMYEQVARLRGELEPATYDFPPDEANDGPGPDGHHIVTGECFACMVGVSTGPESHGDRCTRAAALRGQA